MTKIPYVNIGVKIYGNTSTMQHPAPKLSKVHFNILNLKNKTLSDFLYFLKFPLYFQRALWDSKQRRKTMKIHKYHEYTIYPEISPPIQFG